MPRSGAIRCLLKSELTHAGAHLSIAGEDGSTHDGSHAFAPSTSFVLSVTPRNTLPCVAYITAGHQAFKDLSRDPAGVVIRVKMGKTQNAGRRFVNRRTDGLEPNPDVYRHPCATMAEATEVERMWLGMNPDMTRRLSLQFGYRIDSAGSEVFAINVDLLPSYIEAAYKITRRDSAVRQALPDTARIGQSADGGPVPRAPLVDRRDPMTAPLPKRSRVHVAPSSAAPRKPGAITRTSNVGKVNQIGTSRVAQLKKMGILERAQSLLVALQVSYRIVPCCLCADISDHS